MRIAMTGFVLISLAAACGQGGDPFRPNLSSISVEPKRLGLGLGAVVEYRVEGLTEDGEVITDPRSVRWTSSDPMVAEVTGSGIATGVGLGQTWIIASSTVSRDSGEFNIRICPFGPVPDPLPLDFFPFGRTRWETLPADSIATIFGRWTGRVAVHLREVGQDVGFPNLVSTETIERMVVELEQMELNICFVLRRVFVVVVEIPPPLLSADLIRALQQHPNIWLVEP